MVGCKPARVCKFLLGAFVRVGWLMGWRGFGFGGGLGAGLSLDGV